MDFAGDGIPALSGGTIDLHLHSTASDGSLSPAAVVHRAAAAGLRAVALTDHDTLAGVSEARAAGEATGLRVVAGCEFSVAAPWGEMHILGYFLPPDSPTLEAFLRRCRDDRRRRAEEMVNLLRRAGADLLLADVLQEAAGGAIGRPHVARALVRRALVPSVDVAFERYLRRGRPAFVAKRLPSFAEVSELVHRAGGLVSAAHLKEHGTRSRLTRLRGEGLDAVETRHPGHDPDTRARLTDLALTLDLLRTGGSDWHGDPGPATGQAGLGSQQVPWAWLDLLDARRAGPHQVER